MISLQNLSVVTPGKTGQQKVLLHNTSLNFESGKVHAIVGPNGSGKTTLMRAMTGLIRPDSGKIMINDQSIAGLSPLKIASLVSYIESEHYSPFAFTVADTISWGRWHCHQGFPTAQDHHVALESARLLNLDSFLDRATNTLSLGERKKTHLAKSLASETPHLIWDEPLAPLDIKAAMEVMNITRQRAKTQSCVILSIHDLAMALNYADTITIVHFGKTVWHGKNTDSQCIQALESVFDIKISMDRSSSQSQFFINMKPL